MRQYLAAGICLLILIHSVALAGDDPVLTSVAKSHIPPLTEAARFSGAIRLCGETIPYHIQDVRERLEKEMMLAVWDRPQVVLWLKRAHRYFPHIEKILKEERLPDDLKYVPVVESALRPHSRSSKGAVGYWQFLRSTGTRYGLRIDKQWDERRNLIKSTRAASKYIHKLNREFDSYLLALAAYNMGEFGLKTEIEAQENRDFFSLYLPLETQRYVMKIVAVKRILENPKAYGFKLAPEDLYPVFDYAKVKFSLKGEIPLSVIAKAAGISFKTLKDYNPDVRGYYLDAEGSTVLVPKGHEKGFEKRFISLHRAWHRENRVKYHVVRPGESLTEIANQHKMTLSALLRLNNFSYNKVIHPGDRLMVR